MSTPWLDEYIEVVGDSDTLLIGSRAIWCNDPSDLLRTGPSVGSNLPVARQDGTSPRDRRRGELAVELRQLRIDGAFNENNQPVAASQRRSNLLNLIRKVATFADLHCEGRQCLLVWHTGGDVYEGDAQFEAVGTIDPVGPDFVETDLLFTVHAGWLVQAESGSG